MKEGLTEVVCILDRSGSMASIIDDAIGGFNSFLEEQKKLEGECNFTVALFDDEYILLKDNVSVADVEPFTKDTYVPRSMTALYDAIGKTVTTVGERLAKLDESERPEKIMVVILTDGHENASKEYKQEKIFEMIQTQENDFKWEFIYLGANQDAMKVGVSLGLKAGSTLNFVASKDGMRKGYTDLSSCVSLYRSSGKVDLKESA